MTPDPVHLERVGTRVIRITQDVDRSCALGPEEIVDAPLIVPEPLCGMPEPLCLDPDDLLGLVPRVVLLERRSAIFEALGFAPDDVLAFAEAAADAPEHDLDDVLHDFLIDFITQENLARDLGRVAALADVLGLVAYHGSAHGYCQGDVLEAVVVATPAWIEKTGAPVETLHTDLARQFETLAGWAFGDVWVGEVLDPDPEDADLIADIAEATDTTPDRIAALPPQTRIARAFAHLDLETIAERAHCIDMLGDIARMPDFDTCALTRELRAMAATPTEAAA